MAEAATNGHPSVDDETEKQTEDSTKEIVNKVDENKNTETPAKHQDISENCPNEETSGETRQPNGSSNVDNGAVVDEKWLGNIDKEKDKCEPSEVNLQSDSNDGNKSEQVVNLEAKSSNSQESSEQMNNREEDNDKVEQNATTVENPAEVTIESETTPSPPSVSDESEANSLETTQENCKEQHVDDGESEIQFDKECHSAEVNAETTSDANNVHDNVCNNDVEKKDETDQQATVQTDKEQSNDKETDKEQSHDKESVENASKSEEETKVESNIEVIPSTQQEQVESGAAVIVDSEQTTESTAESSDTIEKKERKVSSSIWYTNEAEQEPASPKAEGYSTTVVGGVVVRKPISSSSSSPEHKKPSPKISRGSKFKMSLGSLFGKKKTTKSEVKQPETLGVQEDDGKGKQDGSSHKENESTERGENMEVKTVGEQGKEMDVEVGETTEKTCSPAENCVANNDELQHSSSEEDKETHQGEIVPIEEGIAKADVEVTENEPTFEETDEVPEDEDKKLRERIAKRESMSPTHSPEKHMQMRFSYAEGSKDGGKEVEVIGTREVIKRPQNSKSNVPDNHRYSCRELGDVDHEGWLAKRGGGAIFASWKTKWVVLKERHLYYFKTAFDQEAGGVIFLDEKYKIVAAPELRRKFAFKVDCEDPKAQKLSLAADTKEAMDKWLSVLTAASRGEVVINKTSKQSNDNVKMRKKTGSMTKRAGSVLGIGGLYEYDGGLQKSTSPPNRRASYGSSPKGSQQLLAIITSDGEDEPKRQSTNQEETTEHVEAHVNATPSSEPVQDVTKEDKKVTEVKTENTENQGIDVAPSIEVTEVSETQSAPSNEGLITDVSTSVDVNVMSQEKTQEISTSHEEPSAETASPVLEDEPSIAPLDQVTDTIQGTKEEGEEKISMEIEAKEHESKGITEQVSQSKDTITQANQSQDRKQESQLDVKTEESKPQDKLETNQSEQKTQQVSQSQKRIEPVIQSEDRTKQIVPRDATPISKSNYNTTWYFVLDITNDAWMEFQFNPKQSDDELFCLVRNIKDARITITGTPLPGNEERGRAMTMVSSQNTDILKLNELKRSLKEKERTLKAMDELLTQEVNRESIYEWSSRHSYLTEEITSESSLENSTESDPNKTANDRESSSTSKDDISAKEEEKREGKEDKEKEEEKVEPIAVEKATGKDDGEKKDGDGSGENKYEDDKSEDLDKHNNEINDQNDDNGENRENDEIEKREEDKEDDVASSSEPEKKEELTEKEASNQDDSGHQQSSTEEDDLDTKL